MSEQKYNVLVVEDNAVNQKLAARVLEKMGFVVDVANDGKEAVEKCQAKNYNAVLMDCEMPVLDGFGATRLIRQSGNNVPIIAMTGNTSRNDCLECLNAGMNAFLTKPMNFAELKLTLEKWLQ